MSPRTHLRTSMLRSKAFVAPTVMALVAQTSAPLGGAVFQVTVDAVKAPVLWRTSTGRPLVPEIDLSSSTARTTALSCGRASRLGNLTSASWRCPLEFLPTTSCAFP